jgi:hypothetical protein
MKLYTDPGRSVELFEDWEPLTDFIFKKGRICHFYWTDSATGEKHCNTSLRLTMMLSCIKQRKVPYAGFFTDKEWETLPQTAQGNISTMRSFKDPVFDAFLGHYRIPYLRHLAKKPKTLLDSSGQKTASVLNRDTNLPVRTYPEAAWMILALLGEEQGLQVSSVGDKTEYTLTDGIQATPKKSHNTLLKERVDKAVVTWRNSLGNSLGFEDRNWYHEYEELVLGLDPKDRPSEHWKREVEPPLALVHDSYTIHHHIARSQICSTTFKGMMEMAENTKEYMLTVEKQVSELEEAVKNIRENAQKIERARIGYSKIIPNKKEIFFALLEHIQEQAMLYSLPVPDDHDVRFSEENRVLAKREIALLLLEGVDKNFIKKRLERIL